ncbi:MAG TPA: hypothetical protein VGI39_30830 [Polyangiaceae bacterium]
MPPGQSTDCTTCVVETASSCCFPPATDGVSAGSEESGTFLTNFTQSPLVGWSS